MLDEIDYEGRVYKAQELINSGLVTKQEDLPAIGVFASKTALKLEDIRYILASCPLESPEIGTLITYLIRTTAYDEDPEFKIFSFKYKDSVGARINKVSVEMRREILNEYSLAFARILGYSAGRFEKIKAIKAIGAHGHTSLSETLNNFTCLGESVDNSGVMFGATTAQIATYQESLLDFATLIPDFVNMDLSERLDMKHKAISQFIEGYLDEMLPDWRKLQVKDEFLASEGHDFGVEQISVQRAYWVAKIKLEKKYEEIGENGLITKSDLANLVYDFLSHIFNDRPRYEKTEKFLNDFLSTPNNN